MKLRICLLLVVLTAAVSSFAQTRPREFEDEVSPTVEPWSGEISYATGQYMDNPCTAVQDWVWVEYSADAFGNQAELGVDRYLFDENTYMGGIYAASGASSADVGYANAVTTRHYHKVNTPDDFHVVTVINWDPISKSMTLGLETACGNGMPDSAQ